MSVWRPCAAPSSLGRRDAHGKLKEKVIFSPKTPKAARKYMSLLSISHRMANHSFAKHSHGSTPAIIWSQPSMWTASPTQREMRWSDGNSGPMHIVPRFPHLQTGVNCAALLCEEHGGSPGEGPGSHVRLVVGGRLANGRIVSRWLRTRSPGRDL